MVHYSDNPAVHIFADTRGALARMRRTAEAAQCRILSASLIGPDADPAAHAMPGAALLIELEGEDAGRAAALLLDRARHDAERGARRSVVSAPVALIDPVAARTLHPGVAHLCEADEDARIDAIAAATAKLAPSLHDSGRDDASYLPQLFEVGTGESGGPDVDAAAVRAMIRARRLREQYFPGLFADPVWDILLDLMAARLERKKVPVSSLCTAAAVPTTTALRWIAMLTERGLLVRATDAGDRRRVLIALSDETARSLAACLRAMTRTCPPAV